MYAYLPIQAGVLRKLKPRSEMRQALAVAFDRCVTEGLFRPDMAEEQTKLYKLVENGLLEELPVEVFFTNPKTGVIYTKRGTNGIFSLSHCIVD
jgi:hypothetical protein